MLKSRVRVLGFRSYEFAYEVGTQSPPLGVAMATFIAILTASRFLKKFQVVSFLNIRFT